MTRTCADGVPAFGLVLCLLFVSGCTAARPAPEVVTVRVPMPVSTPCVSTLPDVPAWAVAALPTGQPIGVQVRALMAERQQRIGYESRLLAVIEGCR